jgi:hypothetical protein
VSEQTGDLCVGQSWAIAGLARGGRAFCNHITLAFGFAQVVGMECVDIDVQIVHFRLRRGRRRRLEASTAATHLRVEARKSRGGGVCIRITRSIGSVGPVVSHQINDLGGRASRAAAMQADSLGVKLAANVRPQCGKAPSRTRAGAKDRMPG